MDIHIKTIICLLAARHPRSHTFTSLPLLNFINKARFNSLQWEMQKKQDSRVLAVETRFSCAYPISDIQARPYLYSYLLLPFGVYFRRSCVYGQPQQHCGSTTRWVAVCLWIVSYSVCFHSVSTLHDPSRGCFCSFLEPLDGGLFDAWCSTHRSQELYHGWANKTSADNLHWLHMAFPAIVLNLVFQVKVFYGFPLWALSMLASRGIVSTAGFTDAVHLTIPLCLTLGESDRYAQGISRLCWN